MATRFYITASETNEDGIEVMSKKMRLTDFLTKVNSVSFNDPIQVNRDFNAKFGQKIKAKADKEPFTIVLPKYSKGVEIKDIDFKLDSRENDITVVSSEGLDVNGLDKLVFSGTREKASFEYDPKSNSWILW